MYNVKKSSCMYGISKKRIQNNRPTSACFCSIVMIRDKKERAKEQKYEELCHAMGYSFLAASLEIFGSMTNKLDTLIRRLVEMAADRSQIPLSTLLPYWRKRLSMNIQQGNARSWMDSTVRMSGADSLQDSSLNLATHHIRSVAL